MESVGGADGALDAGVGHHFFDVAHYFIALLGGGPQRDNVIIVKLEAVAVSLSEAFDAIEGRDFGAGCIAKRIPTPILEAPNPKGKSVFAGGV